MARYKLVEYLDDPSLLLSTSIEELQDWAKEAPYSGLIRRLIAQKLAVEKSVDQNNRDTANTLAILSNVNPHHTISSIEDFRKLILKADVSKGIDSVSKEPTNVISLPDELSVSQPSDSRGDQSKSEEESDVKEASNEPDFELEELEKDKVIFEQKILNESDIKNKSDSEDDFNDFLVWLNTLKPITTENLHSKKDIELSDKELASEGLAELLVKQGHTQRAIQMYEILKLKNPEKSSFFADQIEKLKAL